MHSLIWGCQKTFPKICSKHQSQTEVNQFKGIYEYAEPIYTDTYEYAKTRAEGNDRNKDLRLSFRTEET